MYELAEVRIRLDQMTERIISRLKDRSRFPRNPSVYAADGVPIEGRSGISLLDFAIEGLEIYHGSLGRFSFPDQYALLDSSVRPSPVHRTVAADETPRVDIPLKDHLVAFYMGSLDRLCADGDDPDTFGETAYVDADLLNLLNERINIGRHIAAAKITGNPELSAIVPDSARLTTELRDETREAALLQVVAATAERYQLDPAAAQQLFRWVIDETLALEVTYLQGLQAKDGLASLLR